MRIKKKRTKKQLKDWYKAFPVAKICLGNHDLLVQRKAKTAGLSKHFIYICKFEVSEIGYNNH